MIHKWTGEGEYDWAITTRDIAVKLPESGAIATINTLVSRRSIQQTVDVTPAFWVRPISTGNSIKYTLAVYQIDALNILQPSHRGVSQR